MFLLIFFLQTSYLREKNFLLFTRKAHAAPEDSP